MPDANDLYKEGEALKDAGDLEAAVEKFQQAIAADASFALPHFALAVTYGKLNRHEDAVKHGQKAVELDPNDPFSYTAMSVTYQRAYAGTQDMQYIQLAEDAMARAHAMQAQQ